MRELAERQHGVFARWQLLGMGFGPKVIDGWLEREGVETVHRGVYALSRELLTREGRWMAAVLATGPDAVLSHGSAAAHWRIRGHSGLTEVTAPRKFRPRPGVIAHCLPIAPDEMTVHDGIPVTTPGRTLFDIAHQVRPQALEKAMRESEYLRLAGGPSLPELVQRYPGRTGIVAVRRLLERGWSESPTREELELRFAAFIDYQDLPRPERNALIDLGDRRFEVDFLWRRPQVVVELDGYAVHSTRHAFEDDRERDRRLQLAEFIIVRVTWRQLQGTPTVLARDLHALVKRTPIRRAP